MDVVYGIQALEKDDPYIDAAEAALQSIKAAGNPGNGNYLGKSSWAVGSVVAHLVYQWIRYLHVSEIVAH